MKGRFIEFLMLVGYIFKGKCSQKPDLVSQSGSKQNCHFKIPYISFFLPKIYLLYGINFEILAKGWICFWKSISFPLRFFWLFSRELLFFGNILLLFSFNNNASDSNMASYSFPKLTLLTLMFDFTQEIIWCKRKRTITGRSRQEVCFLFVSFHRKTDIQSRNIENQGQGYFQRCTVDFFFIPGLL